MGGFRSDLGQLTKHAGEFETLAGTAQHIADSLRQAVESAGSCWGTDEVGAGFARTHCGPAEDALSQIGALPGRMREMGATFAATAQTTEQADTGNAAELGRLLGER